MRQEKQDLQTGVLQEIDGQHEKNVHDDGSQEEDEQIEEVDIKG